MATLFNAMVAHSTSWESLLHGFSSITHFRVVVRQELRRLTSFDELTTLFGHVGSDVILVVNELLEADQR